ncbi:MAG: hypothetical protein H0Z24_09140 [Thermosipho sp. (in: Bacteria)]|nr:hypothetical protein [Thermosipho sp. (in: thermotogales)]
MAIERIGLRRLFKAIGTSTKAEGYSGQFSLGSGKGIDIYIGPIPPLGLSFIEGFGPIWDPDEEHLMIKYTRAADPSKTDWVDGTYVDLLVWKDVEVADEISIQFRNEVKGAEQPLFEMVENDRHFFQEILEGTAGIIAILLHEQFVLKELATETVALRRGSNFAIQLTSLPMRIPQKIHLKDQGFELLRSLLNRISTISSKHYKILMNAFRWYHRAICLTETVDQFVSLFIPLETILSFWPSPDIDPKFKLIVNRIRNVIKNDVEAQETLNHLMERYTPSLFERFSYVASRYEFADIDIKAFNEFKKMRNRLFHKGNTNVNLSVDIFTEHGKETVFLDKLVAKYLRLALIESLGES